MKKIICFIALLAVAGCREQPRAAGTNAAADTGGTAVVGISHEIDFANGLLSGETVSQEINRNLLFLPLLRYDEHLQLAPMLATSWQFSGDTAVTLKLRDDVHWHDGVRVSAYDVAFTYRYGVDPEVEYPNGDYWVGWNKAQALDSSTVRFSISRQPDALANLPFIPIMPAHLLDSIKPENIKTAAFNQHPIGDGPFRFVEHRANDRWVFEANRSYPTGLGGRPNLDRIVFRVIPDETAQEAELISGGTDLTALRPDRAQALRAKPQIRIIQKPGRQFAFIGWNTRRPPLDDARVRRALTYALDRQKMLQVVRNGLGEIAVGPVPAFHWSYDKSVKPLPYAPDSAKALFAAAGLSDRNHDGKLELTNGKPFAIELQVPANNRQNADAAELIRADLAAVGVQVDVRPLDFNTVIGNITSSQRKFDAVLMAWESDFRLVLHDQFHSKAIDGQFQFSSYRNAQVDSLLDLVESTPSRVDATPAWRRIQLILRDEQPWTFLFYYHDVYGVRDRLQNVDMDIRGALTNVARWKIVE